MFPRLLCPFCGHSLADLFDEAVLDEINPCPRCGVALTFTTDTAGVDPLLAQVVYGKSLPTDEQVRALVVHILRYVDEEDGQAVHLAAAWNPADLLDTEQVARAMGWGGGRRVVATAIMRGRFPHAQKDGEEWRIPRHDVYEAIRR